MDAGIFKRVISRGVYRPEIDGLRFIAIISVILFHIDGFLSLYMDKTSILSVSHKKSRAYRTALFDHYFVILFFVEF